MAEGFTSLASGMESFAQETAFRPISTGLPELDKELDGGLLPGITLIGAAPDMGQSAFLMKFAETSAKNYANGERTAASGAPVLYFSARLTEKFIQASLISSSTVMTNTENEADVSLGVSTGLLLNSKNAHINDEAVSKAQEKLKDALGNIYIISGTDRDITSEISRFTDQFNTKPLVLINDIDLFSRGGEPMTSANNMSALGEFAAMNGISVAASCVLDIQKNEKIDRMTFKKEGIAGYKADLLLSAGFTAILDNKLTYADKEERSKILYIDLTVLRKPFGPPGKRISFEYIPEYCCITQIAAAGKPNKKITRFYINNTNLSVSEIFKSTVQMPEQKDAEITFSLQNIRAKSIYLKYNNKSIYYTISSAEPEAGDSLEGRDIADILSEDKPVLFGDEPKDPAGNIMLFSYFDLILCDAIYTLTKQKKKKTKVKIDFASIYRVLTGGAARNTDSRTKMLWHSLAKLALTNITFKDSDPPENKSTSTEDPFMTTVPILPLSSEQRKKLRESYAYYKLNPGSKFEEIMDKAVQCDDEHLFYDKHRMFIVLEDEMPLFKLAERLQHIKNFPSALLNVPNIEKNTDHIRNTDHILMIKHFIIRRLEAIRENNSPENKKELPNFHHIRFDNSLFARIGWPITSKYDKKATAADRQKSYDRPKNANKTIIKILEYYVSINYIYGFEQSEEPGFIMVKLLPDNPYDPHPIYVNDPDHINWSRASKMQPETQEKTSDDKSSVPEEESGSETQPAVQDETSSDNTIDPNDPVYSDEINAEFDQAMNIYKSIAKSQ